MSQTPPRLSLNTCLVFKALWVREQNPFPLINKHKTSVLYWLSFSSDTNSLNCGTLGWDSSSSFLLEYLPGTTAESAIVVHSSSTQKPFPQSTMFTIRKGAPVLPAQQWECASLVLVPASLWDPWMRMQCSNVPAHHPRHQQKQPWLVCPAMTSIIVF